VPPEGTGGRQPPAAVETGGQVRIPQPVVQVVGGPAVAGDVHVVGRAGQGRLAPRRQADGLVQAVQVGQHLRGAGEPGPAPVHQRLGTEQQVAVGVVGELVASGGQPPGQVGLVFQAGFPVPAEGRVVVVAETVPVGAAGTAGPVRVVAGGAADDVEGSGGAEGLQGLGQQHGQALVPAGAAGTFNVIGS